MYSGPVYAITSGYSSYPSVTVPTGPWVSQSCRPSEYDAHKLLTNRSYVRIGTNSPNEVDRGGPSGAGTGTRPNEGLYCVRWLFALLLLILWRKQAFNILPHAVTIYKDDCDVTTVHSCYGCERYPYLYIVASFARGAYFVSFIQRWVVSLPCFIVFCWFID